MTASVVKLLMKLLSCNVTSSIISTARYSGLFCRFASSVEQRWSLFFFDFLIQSAFTDQGMWLQLDSSQNLTVHCWRRVLSWVSGPNFSIIQMSEGELRLKKSSELSSGISKLVEIGNRRNSNECKVPNPKWYLWACCYLSNYAVNKVQLYWKYKTVYII